MFTCVNVALDLGIYGNSRSDDWDYWEVEAG